MDLWSNIYKETELFKIKLTERERDLIGGKAGVTVRFFKAPRGKVSPELPGS
jgi:hypothetical protein